MKHAFSMPVVGCPSGLSMAGEPHGQFNLMRDCIVAEKAAMFRKAAGAWLACGKWGVRSMWASVIVSSLVLCFIVGACWSSGLCTHPGLSMAYMLPRILYSRLISVYSSFPHASFQIPLLCPVTSGLIRSSFPCSAIHQESYKGSNLSEVSELFWPWLMGPDRVCQT